MTAGPLRISIVGDARDMQRSMSQAEDAMESAASTARTAGARIDSAFDSTAESADNIASKGAQAAGALSGLGDLIGGPWGAAMQAGAVATQAAADAGDLLNVVTESTIVRKAKDIAATVAQKTATLATAAATKAQAAAQRGLNLVMAANPILLVVAALAALVAGFVIAYKKSETFRKIVDKAFAVIKAAAKKVADFFTKTLPHMFDKLEDAASAARKWITRRFEDVVNWFRGIPGRVARAAGDIFGTIRDKAGAAKEWVTDRFNGLVDWFRNLPGKIGRALSGLRDKFRSIFTGAFDAIIGLWNSIDFGIHFNLTIPSWVPGIGGKGFGINIDDLFPDIPRLASGGITTGPTLAVVGDNPGGREAIIPLDKYGALGGNTYKINVYVAPGGDLVEAGRQITRAIDAYESAGGRRRA